MDERSRGAVPPDAVTSYVDRLCDRFEAELRDGGRPQIEDYLAQAPETERAGLLCELLLLEQEYLGAPADDWLSQSQQRFPQYAEQLARRCPRPTAAESADTPAVTRLLPRAAAGLGTAPFSGPAAELAQIWPFSDLSRVLVREMAEAMEERHYAPGEVLIAQGEEPRHLIVVVEGDAEVRLQNETQAHRVATVAESRVVGEMSLLTGEPATASVIASTPVRALVLSAEDFDRLAQRHHLLWLALNRLVAERLGQNVVDVLVGKTLSGYHIERCVGRGGMAVVYEARELATGRRVALKMMSHRFAEDFEARVRFDREMEICRTLRHPNIARTYDRFEAFGTHFMVMEFCPGQTLAELIRRAGPLPEEQIRRIVGQLAAALAYAHRAGICHRDLKPANVMISDQGQVKLTDFGLAKADCSADLTAQGHILGTLRYMPPEQLTGEAVDYRADLFAFGCIAYEMVTGRPLFQGSDLLGVLSQHLSWTLPPADELRAGLSAELYAVLREALARDPAQRVLDLNRLAAWGGPVDRALLAR